jgi:NAD(P)-dependent dehydrogenase (short-subunit alcohol dehydrogenase family)
MNPTYDFSGQVAVVTGAGAGMGLDTARAFAAAGAAVALDDVNEDAVRTATDELTAAGHPALGVTCDVADEDQVAALVERTVAEFGRLDMAFNSAGIMLPLTDAADEPAERLRLLAAGRRGPRRSTRCRETSASSKRSSSWRRSPTTPASRSSTWRSPSSGITPQ